MENVSIKELLTAVFSKNINVKDDMVLSKFNELVDKYPKKMYNLMFSLFITDSPMNFIKVLIENDLLAEILVAYENVLNFVNKKELSEAIDVFNHYLASEYSKVQNVDLTKGR